MDSAGKEHEIVIVGGGVAGLEIAVKLGRRYDYRSRITQPIRVTLIDKLSAHIWKPILHEIAAGTREVGLQQTTYVNQALESGFIYQPGQVCGLDRESRKLHIAPLHSSDGRLLVPKRSLSYDTLVIAVGSETNDFNIPGVSKHCLTINSYMDADFFNREMRMRVLQCLTEKTKLSIAIVGGGATGVELAAEVAKFIELTSIYGEGSLVKLVEITLIDSGERLLSTFPEKISFAAKSRLELLGIAVITNAKVSAVSRDGFKLTNGTFLSSTLKIWAAGVKAPNFLCSLDGLETTKNNQLKILPNLTTSFDRSIYAIGDCASLTTVDDKSILPPTAQVAHQQAQHLINHLPYAVINRVPVPRFIYRNLGKIVSISDYDAYGSLGQLGFIKGMTIRGRLALMSHYMLYRTHQFRIHGFCRGTLLWLVDVLNARLKSKIRLN